MRRLLPVVLLGAAVLSHAAPAYAGARFVGSRSAFQRAVSDFQLTGGRIILLPGDYKGPLVVGPRSRSALDIVGSQGTRVQTLELLGTQAVAVRNLVVRPLGGKAGIVAERSRNIISDMRDLYVAEDVFDLGRNAIAARDRFADDDAAQFRRGHFLESAAEIGDGGTGC